MKLFYNCFVQKWVINIIPAIHIYVETFSPLNHKRLTKDGLSGVYLSFSWLKWEIIIGLVKK